MGHIVGRRRPRSSTSRFYVVDFGLKSEAPFAGKEIPGSTSIGDRLAMPLVELEDDFNEPAFDYENRAQLPALQVERYALLTKTARNDSRFVHGRFTSFKKGGANVKVLGTQAFVPRHHVMAIDRPILGSYAPFYVISVSADKRPSGVGLDVNPVVSSYGGFLFCLANLVGRDDIWAKAGADSSKERIAYLRLLTRILVMKNAAVRRMVQRSGRQEGRFNRNRRANKQARTKEVPDSAWLNDLPRGDWASSSNPGNRGGQRDENQISWDRMRRPFPGTVQKAKMNERDGRSLSRAWRNSGGKPVPTKEGDTHDDAI